MLPRASLPRVGCQLHSDAETDQLRGSARVSSCSLSDGGYSLPGSGSHPFASSGSEPASAAELGLAASMMERLERHLKQAERNLAVQHAGALRIVSQLLGSPAEAPPGQCEPDVHREQLSFNFKFRSRLAVPHRHSQTEQTGRRSWGQTFPPHMEESRTQVPVQILEPQPPAEPPSTSIQADKLEPTDHQSPHTRDSERTQHFNVSPVFRNTRRTHHDGATGKTMNLSSSHLSENNPHENTIRGEGWCKRFIQDPNTVFRAFYDILCMVLVLYDMVMVPFDFFEPEETTFMIAMTWIIRAFWTFDIPMSFTWGYVTTDGTIEMRPAKIALKYLRTWFFLDITVTTLDWSELVLGNALDGADVAKIGRTTQVFRIIRLTRLSRLMKVGEIVGLLFERLPSEKLMVGMGILKLIVIMLGVGHLVACFWYWIGMELRPFDRENWNWLQRFDFEGESLNYKYIMSFRWALSQFAGGMDEVTPVNLAEHIFASLISLFAYWSGTVFLSMMTSHFTQLYILVAQQSQQVTAMRRYLAANNISKALTVRVVRNAQHCLRMRQPASGLLELVSNPLQIEIHWEMYFQTLNRHPFFRDYMEFCPFVVRRICHEAMTMSTFSKGDVIFYVGEAAGQMHIVRTGTLVYSWDIDGSTQSVDITEGKWLSEPALWTQWSYRGVLTSYEDSIVFAVSADVFQAIASKFDPAVFNPCDYALNFVRRLNEMPLQKLTDMPIEIQARRSCRHSISSRASWHSMSIRMPVIGTPTIKFWPTWATVKPWVSSEESSEEFTKHKSCYEIAYEAKVPTPQSPAISHLEGSHQEEEG